MKEGRRRRLVKARKRSNRHREKVLGERKQTALLRALAAAKPDPFRRDVHKIRERIETS